MARKIYQIVGLIFSILWIVVWIDSRSCVGESCVGLALVLGLISIVSIFLASLGFLLSVIAQIQQQGHRSIWIITLLTAIPGVYFLLLFITQRLGYTKTWEWLKQLM